MIITPTAIRVAEDHRQEALAWADRARLVAAATKPSSSAAPRPVGRIRAGVRHAVAALGALAPIG